MAAKIITIEDLHTFKQELLDNLKELLAKHPPPPKKWMKSREAGKLLQVSQGTLHNMRINGSLPYTRIGRVIYYYYDDIMKVLEDNKMNGESTGLLREPSLPVDKKGP